MIYPSGFHWAWTSGSENLKEFADWHLPACKDKSKGAAITKKILQYMGFGKGTIEQLKNTNLQLAVMDLSKETSLFVPTMAGWYLSFQQDFGLNFPLSVQKSLALGLGAKSTRAEIPIDPIKKFVNITGCSAKAAAQCDDAPITKCMPSYQKMSNQLCKYNPYGDSLSNTTAQCVAAYKSELAGREPEAAEIRAMFRWCQDVNPCNTFLGYGYNPDLPSPGAFPVEHFTGREFVLRNQSLRKVNAVLIRLPRL